MWRKVDIQNVFLVTNGKRVSRDLLYWFSRIYSFCTENEVSGFGISNDRYHVQERGFVRDTYEYEELLYSPEYDDCEPIDLPEDTIKYHTNINNLNASNILARGRAKDWGGRNDPYLDCLKFDNLKNPTEINGDLYVCYNGDVVGDANMSYLDMKKFVRGNVKDWDSLMEGIYQSTIDNYNWCSKNCSCFESCGEYDTLQTQMSSPLKVG